MTWVAAGIGTASVAASIYGSTQASSAAKGAAGAQQDAANNYQKYVQGQENDALSLLGTPSQMAAYDQAISAQEGVVQKQEQLAQTLSPDLVNIGSQLHDVLNGKSAPALANLQNQRDRQRQQLVSSLQQQMGPGAESSTAGMQALDQFDSETANQMSNAQQDYTKTLLGASLSSPEVMNALGGANMQLGQLNMMSPDAQKAQLMAQFSGQGAGAQQAQIQAAGGQYAAQAIQAQMYGNLGNTLATGAGAYAGSQKNKSAVTPNIGATGPSNYNGTTMAGGAGDPGSLQMNYNPNFSGMQAKPGGYIPGDGGPSGVGGANPYIYGNYVQG